MDFRMHHPASETGHLIAQATADQNGECVSQLVTSSSQRGIHFMEASQRSRPTEGCGSYNAEEIPSFGLVSNSNPSPTSTLRSEERDYYRFERHRLLTFSSGWPASCPVTPQDLAAAGMYYVGVEDIVRCAFCQTSLKQWAPGDSARAEHQKYSPLCPFICGQNVGNVPIEAAIHRSTSFPIEFRQDMLQGSASPCIVAYSSLDSRLRSYPFEQLPSGQNAVDLANAGFFYLGPGDAVQCYWCGGSLKQWAKADQPWSEHLRWFPHCGLLRQQSKIPTNQNVKTAQVPCSRLLQETSSNDDRSQTVFSQASGHSLIPLFVEQARVEDSAPNFVRAEVADNVKPTNKSAAKPSEPLSIITGAETNDHGNLELLQEENRRLKNTLQCKICMDEDVDTLFLPCGHLVCCEKCASTVTICPMCRVDIRGTIRTYIS